MSAILLVIYEAERARPLARPFASFLKSNKLVQEYRAIFDGLAVVISEYPAQEISLAIEEFFDTKVPFLISQLKAENFHGLLPTESADWVADRAKARDLQISLGAPR